MQRIFDWIAAIAHIHFRKILAFIQIFPHQHAHIMRILMEEGKIQTDQLMNGLGRIGVGRSGKKLLFIIARQKIDLPQHDLIQFLLIAEIFINHALVHARFGGDFINPGAIKAQTGKMIFSSNQDFLPGLFCARLAPGGRFRHLFRFLLLKIPFYCSAKRHGASMQIFLPAVSFLLHSSPEYDIIN